MRSGCVVTSMPWAPLIWRSMKPGTIQPPRASMSGAASGGAMSAIRSPSTVRVAGLTSPGATTLPPPIVSVTPAPIGR